MKLTTILALFLAMAVIPSANAGTKKIGSVNGVDFYRIKTMGIFCPSTTTVVAVNTNRPGTIEGVIVNANSPGVLGQVAAPASIAAGAYLLKPSQTKVTQDGGGSEVNNVNSSTATGGNGGAGGTGNGGNGGSGGFIPPGHLGTNPSGNH